MILAYAFAEQILFKVFDKILYKLSELTHNIKEIGHQGFRLWLVSDGLWLSDAM